MHLLNLIFFNISVVLDCDLSIVSFSFVPLFKFSLVYS